MQNVNEHPSRNHFLNFALTTLSGSDCFILLSTKSQIFGPATISIEYYAKQIVHSVSRMQYIEYGPILKTKISFKIWHSILVQILNTSVTEDWKFLFCKFLSLLSSSWMDWGIPIMLLRESAHAMNFYFWTFNYETYKPKDSIQYGMLQKPSSLIFFFKIHIGRNYHQHLFFDTFFAKIIFKWSLQCRRIPRSSFLFCFHYLELLSRFHTWVTLITVNLHVVIIKFKIIQDCR